jgi:Uma2 family endonuclease
MTSPYPETIGGELLMRLAPDARHEAICDRLHRVVGASVANLSSTRLLPPRSQVRLGPDTIVAPDLALVTVPNGKAWLIGEIISSGDNRPDTVIKKQIYEELKIPRLWMIDPRYDNVEVYHASPFGIALHEILAGRQILSEKLLPEFQIVISYLFETQSPGG